MSASDSVAPNLYADVLAAPHAAGRAAPRPVFPPALALTEITLEFVLSAGGFLLSSFVDNCMFGQSAWSLRASAPAAIALALILVLLLHRDGTRERGSGLLRIRETERTLRCAWQAIFLIAVMIPLFAIHLSAMTILFSAGIVPALLIGKGQLLFPILRRQMPAERVVIYGAGDAARAIVATLRTCPRLGLLPVAVIEDEAHHNNRQISGMDYRPSDPVPVLAGPVTPVLLHSLHCKVLVIAAANVRGERVEQAMRVARDAGLTTTFVYLPPAADQQTCINLDGFVLHTPAEGDAKRLHVKRGIDILASALLLILLAPLLLLVALVIRLDSPGPALFVQERVGRNGGTFRIYKFRSMHVGWPKYAPSPISSADPRITRIGRMLRRMSLDELPQLLNVLLGDMSLVGPRPEMPFIVDEYGPEERRRLQALPGITGLWQLSADRALPIHENLEYDLYYIRNRTLSMDIAILIHTLIFAPRRGV